MNLRTCLIAALPVLVSLVVGCGQRQSAVEQQESRTAKELLQGVWLDEETEAVAFQMRGDTVYYADSTSMPAYFKVVADTLCIGSTTHYHIEKHTAHLLWFTNQNGELAKFVKSDDIAIDTVFEHAKPQILALKKVLKRDTVVFYDDRRYHLYVAINPTRYKVVKQTVNEDGLNVENVYYDNIIHLSIFQGASQVFSRDFRKQAFEQRVPKGYLQQAVLNDLQYSHTDAQGFHFNVSLCIPDEASCYLIGQTVSFDGSVTTKLLEY